MNPEKQRIAIAEAYGWVRVNTSPVNIRRWTHKDCPDCNSGEAHSHSIDELPDYLKDRNACAQFEDALDNPSFVFSNGQKGSLGLYDVYATELSKRFGRSIRATAAQRAEAFLRTIGKWTTSAAVEAQLADVGVPHPSEQ